jgi:predicted TPR repeat methyltransferase
MGLHRFEDAVAAFKKAIGLRPYSRASYGRLGLALSTLGRLDDAREVYQQWLAKDPDNPVAKHLIAACSGKDVPLRAPDEVVKQLFDGFAESFDAVLQGLLYRAPMLIEDAIAQASGPPDRTLDVLDAGCGTGLCAALLRPYARKLIGVDLSPGMLRRAGQTALYDELVCCELTQALWDRPGQVDVIASADTLCYFGALEEAMRAASGALRPNGLLVFTLESIESADAPGGFCLRPLGRYAHTEDYARACLERACLRPLGVARAHLRLEMRAPVEGWVVTARASDR